MENQNTQWEEVQAGVWKPEKEGDSIEGVLINKKDEVGINNSKAYYIENKDGVHMVWGSTVLNERMQLVNVGELIKITYKGAQENKKGQPTKIFRVDRAKQQAGSTIESPKVTKEVQA